MADDVQPGEGQGTEATGSQFDSYLQTVPEGGREAAEAWFKDTSKDLNEKLDQAAEVRKTWEPWEPVKDTLAAYTPEQLSELLAWHQQVTSDPDAYKQWLGNAAKEAGLSPAQADALESAEELGDLSREDIEKIIAEQAEQRVAPLQEQLTQLQTEQAVNAEEAKIRSRIDELQKEAKVSLTEGQKAVVFDLGANSEEEDWVKAGFDRFRSIYSEGQKAFVEEKASPQAPPVTGGGREQFKPTTQWAEAEKQARERLRQAQS